MLVFSFPLFTIFSMTSYLWARAFRSSRRSAVAAFPRRSDLSVYNAESEECYGDRGGLSNRRRFTYCSL